MDWLTELLEVFDWTIIWNGPWGMKGEKLTLSLITILEVVSVTNVILWSCKCGENHTTVGNFVESSTDNSQEAIWNFQIIAKGTRLRHAFQFHQNKAKLLILWMEHVVYTTGLFRMCWHNPHPAWVVRNNTNFFTALWNAESFSWHKIVISWGNSHTYTKSLGTWVTNVMQTYQELQFNPKIMNLHAHAPHINTNSWLLIISRSFSQRTFHKLHLSKFFLGRKTIHTECINICMYLLPIILPQRLCQHIWQGIVWFLICKPNTKVRFRPAVVPSRIHKSSRFE